jgi:hypothetical protein
MHPEMENYLRVLRRDAPTHVCYPTPTRGAAYRGAWPAQTRPDEDTLEWRDEWGVLWRDLEGEIFPVGPAVESCEEVGQIEPPDPAASGRMAPLKRVAADLDRDRYFLGVTHPYFMYEKAIDILGPEEFGVAMLAAPERAHELLDKILEFELGIAREYVRFEPDEAMLNDDFGHQDRLAMSPDCWREFFKPRLRTMVDFYREHIGPDAPVGLHSCGHVMPILEDLMEVGITILHPVQSTANDLPELRRITSGRMTLAGGIDGQKTLPLGTPEDVRRETLRKLEMLWENGGYLPMPEKRHGVPEQNLDAMKRAIRDWSRENVESRPDLTTT